ncbi:MAG TPA: DUF6600 domain-containing protein [Acetobacteraceae bacterium]|nr:DUF6600 domain-containing protein [Acetobacteraceae bacterium]
MRTQNRAFRLTATVAVAALLLAQALPQPAHAQGVPPQPPQPSAQDQRGGDPPARVGRLAQLNGTVSFHTQDESEWSPATLNYPVTQGNAYWTQPNARAVIEVSASHIVMAPGTELDVATLTDTAFQATVPQGELYLRVRAAAPDETYAVQTPRGLVTLTTPGRYGVVAGDTQNPTLITVVEGSAHVEGPGVSLDVAANQMASITGTDTFQAEIGPAQHDPFLTAMLNSERPAQAQGVAPPPAVAAMPGGEDLAEYGTWTQSADYGQVWYPQVTQGWVPYREGSWAYVAPWGWTWVDSAPWGFAPFHYGRWAEVGGRWGWVPGTAVGGYQPVYAPALVTFLGIAAAVGVGVGIGSALAGGNVGWLPLGPREPFQPWYHASNNYIRQVNVAHVTNFTTINRNVTINNFVNRGAATVVPTSAMTASRPVASSVQRVDPAQLAQARPVVGEQPLRPASTTAGVTPAVARQLNLAPAASLHAIAPGPVIHAAPVGLSTGAAAGVVAGHQALPTLHNPAQPTLPAAAGAVHPFTATPVLRTPSAPGQIGPPALQHEPGVAGQGAVSHLPPAVNQGGGGATPATITHQPQQFHTAPGATFQQPVPPAVAHLPSTPPVVHTAPPVVHATTNPAPQFHAPPPVVHTPPPVVHTAAPAVVHAAPSPPVAHTPPPQQNAQHKKPGEQ